MSSAGGPAAPSNPRSASKRLLLVLLAVALVGGGAAGLTYARYAAEHLKPRPKAARCLIPASVNLRKPVVVSGTEPRENEAGETVYLTPAQDRAVACASGTDKTLGRRLAGALSEEDPARRANALAGVVRDSAREGPEFDRQVLVAFILSSSALQVLPADLPEVNAASTEIERIYACRFDTRYVCPTRPGIPLLVWLGGVPAAPATLGLLWIGGAAGVRAIRERRRRKRAQSAAKAPAQQAGGE
jgi:hypothetical protein